MQKIIYSIVIFFISGSALLAQSDNEKKYFKEAIQDTVKSESVVMVRDYEEFKITKHNLLDYKINVVLRTQYKLKDAYAVEAFSTMTKSSGLKKIAITQLKADGTLKEIYLNEDKDYNEERSDNGVKLNDGTEKIAVEDLEIGDIVDYRYEYTYTTTTYPMMRKELENGRVYGNDVVIKNYDIFRQLPNFTKFVQERYPVLSSWIVLEAPSELKLIEKAINCSYKFTESSDGDGKVYILKTGYSHAYKSEFFSYKYVDLPVVKFFFVNTANAKMQNMYPYQFNDENVSNDDIAKLALSFYNNPKFMQKYLYYINSKQYPKGYAEVSLSAFFKTFIKTFAADNKNKIDVVNKFHEYLSNNDQINRWQFGKMNFAVLMAKFCDKIKQPYKMIACMPRYNGSWENLIHPSEINWGIYIDDNGTDLFITSTASTSNIYEKYGYLSGTDVVMFNPKDKILNVTTMKYPEIGFKENVSTYESEIEFVDVDQNYDYHFVNTYTYKGAQKLTIDDNIDSKFYPEELSTNAGFWGIVDFRLYNDEIFKDTGDFYPEYRRISNAYTERRKKYSNESFEDFLYSEYHFNKITVDSFRVIEGDGYVDNNESICKFKVEFDAKGVLDKTANGLLIMKLGRLIAEQLEISNFNNNERYTNINNSNQRELDWRIEVEIPEGYTPLNLQDFNMSFENEAGIFKSVVEQKGNKLVIKVEKIYKTNFLPKEKWAEFTTFVKQAVLFYEKRLLLEKK